MTAKLVTALSVLMTAAFAVNASAEQPVDERQAPVFEELSSLPEGETVELDEQEFPAVYGLFASKIQEGPASEDCSSSMCPQIIPTDGGAVALTRTKGVLHILVYAVQPDRPDDDPGLALSVAIDGGGVEILSIDFDRLTRFLGLDIEEADAVPAELQKGELRPVGGRLTLTTADDSNLSCNWTSALVCCALQYPDKFCICCATFAPIVVGCSCVPVTGL